MSSSLGSADAPPVSAVDTQAPRLVPVAAQHGEGGGGSSLLGPAPPLSQRVSSSKRRPARLNLGGNALASSSGSSSAAVVSNSHSVPNSPCIAAPPAAAPLRPSAILSTGLTAIAEQEKQELRNTLTGRPRRRPSMPFGPSKIRAGAAQPPLAAAADDNASLQPPEAWRDPSQDILSGQGSTLQHARSVYAAGPIEVLPGLYLGDEHNARDNHMLASRGITTILNVAKETTLPFQTESNVVPLRKGRHGVWPSEILSQAASADPLLRSGIQRASTVSSDEVFHTPPTASLFSPCASSSSGMPRTPLSAATSTSLGEPTESFMTPISESPPSVLPQSASSHLLRSSLSTPNLQVQFQRASPKQGDRSTGSSDASEEGGGKGSSLYSSEAPPSDQTHATDVESEELAEVDDPDILYSAVELPEDALKLSIPASPSAGRSESIRYIKLPWTHDQTELAAAKGGFAQGCAVISEAMAIDHYGRPLFDDDARPLKPGGVLVHCQCGVSRSATLVIAFVMQAAALNYPYEATKTLTGMHDCYNLVKDLSSSISPNISLIYQLVEWERHLSAEAIRLRDALQRRSSQHSLTTAATVRPGGETGNSAAGEVSSSHAAVGETPLHAGTDAMPRPAAVGWSSEAMGEEEWTRMRMEEERKEQLEDEARRQKLQEETARQAAERRRREQEDGDSVAAVSPRAVPNGLPGVVTSGGGLGARRRMRTPALKLQGSSEAMGSAGGIASASGGRELPLRSARLDGAFPGRLEPAAAREPNQEDRCEAKEIAQRIPTLSINSGEGSGKGVGSSNAASTTSPGGATQSRPASAKKISLGPASAGLTGTPSRPISLPPPPASAVSASSSSPMASATSTPARLSAYLNAGGPANSANVLSSLLPSAKVDFGHTHTSAAERKKQHRRTFSSEPSSTTAMAAALLSSMESIRSAAVASGTRPSEVSLAGAGASGHVAGQAREEGGTLAGQRGTRI